MHNGYGKYVCCAREGQAADALCLLFECVFKSGESLRYLEILPYFLYTIFNYVFHGAPQAQKAHGVLAPVTLCTCRERMNVHDAPHRRLGDPCCGAARQPKNHGGRGMSPEWLDDTRGCTRLLLSTVK